MFQFIEADWRRYASVQYAIIGSYNGLSLVRHQTIMYRNIAILSIVPQETIFNDILIGIKSFH